MRMAFLRRDLYGMIEVLLIAHRESFRAKSPSFKKKKVAIQQQGVENSFPGAFDPASDGRSSAAATSLAEDRLSRNDWKVAGSLALRSNLELPRESFVETFTEVLSSLMYSRRKGFH